MAFEKFAKAALLRSGAIAISAAGSSHKGASAAIAQKLANPNSLLVRHVVDLADRLDRNFDLIFP